MTGYGRATREEDKRSVAVELKSLNSKYLDVSVRLPKIFNEKELEIRNIISEKLIRGKISITIEHAILDGEELSVQINSELFKSYYYKLASLAQSVNADSGDLFKMALQYPDVQIQKQDDEKVEEEWQILKEVVIDAIEKCDSFRQQEGGSLKDKLVSYTENIEQLLKQVEEEDPKRLQELKEKLLKTLTDLKLKEDIDQNRFEQELIYYIDKLDISEEKVRLENHLKYFLEVLNYPDSNGKKLNFISQELGREINTMGAKANYAPIQKLVVNMKDELEKIKEQIQNIV